MTITFCSAACIPPPRSGRGAGGWMGEISDITIQNIRRGTFTQSTEEEDIRVILLSWPGEMAG